eukprot:2100201-Alexandrium_andersonii.AAC.1
MIGWFTLSSCDEAAGLSCAPPKQGTTSSEGGAATDTPVKNSGSKAHCGISGGGGCMYTRWGGSAGWLSRRGETGSSNQGN